MTTCILLAAGLSQRFNSPKALALINNQTVIAKILNELVQSKIDEIILVLGAHQELIIKHIQSNSKIKIVFNPNFINGQTSSFKCGLKNISLKTTAFALLPVDYPFIKSKTIDVLLKQFLKNPIDILIPTYTNLKGHPPIFSSNLKQKFLKLADSEGINSIFPKFQSSTLLFQTNDPGVIQTFNTVEELNKILKTD